MILAMGEAIATSGTFACPLWRDIRCERRMSCERSANTFEVRTAAVRWRLRILSRKACASQYSIQRFLAVSEACFEAICRTTIGRRFCNLR